MLGLEKARFPDRTKFDEWATCAGSREVLASHLMCTREGPSVHVSVLNKHHKVSTVPEESEGVQGIEGRMFVS